MWWLNRDREMRAAQVRLDFDCGYHRDGSISALNLEATGIRLLRTADNEIVLEIDRDGESSVFLQIRGVGKQVAGVRAMFTGDAG